MTTTYISDLYPVQNELTRIEKEFVQLANNNQTETDLTGAINEARLYIQDYLATQHLPSNNPRGASVEPWVYKDENDEYYLEINLGCYGLNSHKRRFYISDWTEAPKPISKCSEASFEATIEQPQHEPPILVPSPTPQATAITLCEYWINSSTYPGFAHFSGLEQAIATIANMSQQEMAEVTDYHPLDLLYEAREILRIAKERVEG